MSHPTLIKATENGNRRDNAIKSGCRKTHTDRQEG
nr:MAG TPA: hypothetical protein [Caudoviricetes sp.]